MCAAPQRALHTPYSDPKPRAPSSEALNENVPRCPLVSRLSKLRPDTRMAAWHGPPVTATGHSTACASCGLRKSYAARTLTRVITMPFIDRCERAQKARICAVGPAAPPARGAARRVDEHTRPESGALLRRADAQRGREEEVCPRCSDARPSAYLLLFYNEIVLW